MSELIRVGVPSKRPNTSIDLSENIYLVSGIMGPSDTGEAIVQFSLDVIPSQHFVSGTIIINQSVPGPDSHVVIAVTGKIYSLDLGQYTQVIALQGSYTHSYPPPHIGSIMAEFNAIMSVDDEWNGIGAFSFWENDVENVPVKATY